MTRILVNRMDSKGNKILEGFLIKIPHNEYIAEGIHRVFKWNGGFVTANILFSHLKIANKYDLDWIIQIIKGKVIKATVIKFYSDTPAGTEGFVIRQWQDPNGNKWAKLYFGENLTGQKLQKSFPIDVLKFDES